MLTDNKKADAGWNLLWNKQHFVFSCLVFPTWPLGFFQHDAGSVQ